ncbi:MAG: PD-(D/E)XK nuclease domain-containing protein, partial [Parabacteroides sp.]
VLYYLSHYVGNGRSPKNLLDPNTKTDYNKLKKLIQLDKLDNRRKSVMREIIEKEERNAVLYESFPAIRLTDPEYFTSLLFYYGMLTIKGTRGSRVTLGIPNNNVRIQYYNYLKEEYEKHHPIDMEQLSNGFDSMAFGGQWRECLQYMADCYKNLSSVRDSIEGERNIQGFFLAYLSLNSYYYTAPELELKHGYCDFFLLPNLTHYKSEHSYILELKYLPKKDFADKAEAQWNEAVEQINAYAIAPRVEALRQGTRLHKIIMQFSGWELARMEEV